VDLPTILVKVASGDLGGEGATQPGGGLGGAGGDGKGP